MKTSRVRTAWAILWRSDNRLDCVTQHLVGDPDHVTRTKLFETREAARAEVKQRYGSIPSRDDLRAEPHGWKMPRVVPVVVSVEMVS